MWMTRNELEREAISHYVSMVLKYAPAVENEETMLHVSENKELPKKNKPWAPDYSGFTSFGRSTTAKQKNTTTTSSSSSSTSTTISGNVTSLQTIAADNLRKQAAETIAKQLKRWPTSCWLVRTMCMELAPYAQMTIFNMAWRILQANIGSMPRIISDMWIMGAEVDPKEVQEWEVLTSDLIVSLEKWTERYDAFESCDEHGAWKQLKEEAKKIAERHLPPHGRLMPGEYEYESEYYVQPTAPGEYCRRSNSFVPTPSSNFGQDFLLPRTTNSGEYQTWGSIGISHLNWFKVLDATIVHGATISGRDKRFSQPDTDGKVEEKKNWKKFTTAKLKVELQARHLSIAGEKADLVERLESNDAAPPSTQKRTASGSLGAVRPQKQRKKENGTKKSSESTLFIVSSFYFFQYIIVINILLVQLFPPKFTGNEEEIVHVLKGKILALDVMQRYRSQMLSIMETIAGNYSTSAVAQLNLCELLNCLVLETPGDWQRCVLAGTVLRPNDNGIQATIHFLPRSFGVVLEKEKKKDYSKSWDY